MDIYWDMFGDIERISMEFINDQQFNNHMGLVEDGGTMVDSAYFHGHRRVGNMMIHTWICSKQQTQWMCFREHQSQVLPCLVLIWGFHSHGGTGVPLNHLF